MRGEDEAEPTEHDIELMVKQELSELVGQCQLSYQTEELLYSKLVAMQIGLFFGCL